MGQRRSSTTSASSGASLSSLDGLDPLEQDTPEARGVRRDIRDLRLGLLLLLALLVGALVLVLRAGLPYSPSAVVGLTLFSLSLVGSLGLQAALTSVLDAVRAEYRHAALRAYLDNQATFAEAGALIERYHEELRRVDRGRTGLKARPDIDQILGKRISAVLGKEGPKTPAAQIMLVFDDETWYEIESPHSIALTGELNTGGLEAARRYQSDTQRIVFEVTVPRRQTEASTDLVC